MILGIIMGIVTFKFMTGKKTMNVYYSLGIKRTHLFTAKYLSGLTLMAVAIFLPILADVIMNTVKLGMSSKLLFSALFYFLGLFSLSALSYSLTAMVFSAVGTVFEGVVFSGIIVSMPAIILYCVQSFIIRLVPGTPFGVVFRCRDIRAAKNQYLISFRGVHRLPIYPKAYIKICMPMQKER